MPDPSMRIYYIIYSADVPPESREMIEELDPNRIERHTAEPRMHAGLWTRTEGDEQYDFDYLGEEYEGGAHGKWVAELNHEEFLALARDRCWDLDDDDRPTHIEQTMGSITEHGHLDAYAVHDYEGWQSSYWGSNPVIDAQFYVSEGLIPEGATCELKEAAHA